MRWPTFYSVFGSALPPPREGCLLKQYCALADKIAGSLKRPDWEKSARLSPNGPSSVVLHVIFTSNCVALKEVTDTVEAWELGPLVLLSLQGDYWCSRLPRTNRPVYFVFWIYKQLIRIGRQSGSHIYMLATLVNLKGAPFSVLLLFWQHWKAIDGLCRHYSPSPVTPSWMQRMVTVTILSPLCQRRTRLLICFIQWKPIEVDWNCADTWFSISWTQQMYYFR